jgi:hypothetical protein
VSVGDDHGTPEQECVARHATAAVTALQRLL